ncbi:hypothetical protein JDV02_004057 [Purpureocillium takamizusanense]|uniref:Amine oxidase domain-containing protein n=1 Tax=Purpureocillium takamizusanense TaxID=2060973 RepID=A0A9Q8V913_9HYPO|nr:uncharacterized protein JDV02_004057 [Purpureocillium takamizusanense]UNI17735.1 hypothetical protein JDV02_004057 [Purpureocillium takamizusanense]
MEPANGIDVWGPWFQGVVALESLNLTSTAVDRAKRSKVAIVGAGMSGLMTYLILHQAGLTNVTIIEGSDRVGGRVHTQYLSGGPFDYSYQELGAMRIPMTVTLSNVTYNISEHRLVLDLIEEMNRLNNDKTNEINLIPFINTRPHEPVHGHGVKLENGFASTDTQTSASSRPNSPADVPHSASDLKDLLESTLPGDDFLARMTANIFQAHSDWIDHGLANLPGDRWSEFAFAVNHLGASIRDQNDVFEGLGSNSFWLSTYDKIVLGPNTQYKTIDGGMSRLPQSFLPLVEPITKFNRKVERIAWNQSTEKLTLKWRRRYNESFGEDEVDYAIIAAPFSVVRRWRLPGMFPHTF